VLQPETMAEILTAESDPEHLKRWLSESGRKFIVLKADDLVDSLQPWPEAADIFIGMVEGYRKHRMKTLSSRTMKAKHPVTNVPIDVPLQKTDVLEVDELDRCIRFLIGQVTSLDENWSLDNPPL